MKYIFQFFVASVFLTFECNFLETFFHGNCIKCGQGNLKLKILTDLEHR